MAIRPQKQVAKMAVYTLRAGETPSRAGLICAHQAGRRGSIYNGAGCGGLCASPQEDTAMLCSTANTEDVVTGCALIPLR